MKSLFFDRNKMFFSFILDEITSSFRRFGPLVVDWPHKAESKSYFPPKGYAFLLFQVSQLEKCFTFVCERAFSQFYLSGSSDQNGLIASHVVFGIGLVIVCTRLSLPVTHNHFFNLLIRSTHCVYHTYMYAHFLSKRP